MTGSISRKSSVSTSSSSGLSSIRRLFACFGMEGRGRHAPERDWRSCEDSEFDKASSYVGRGMSHHSSRLESFDRPLQVVGAYGGPSRNPLEVANPKEEFPTSPILVLRWLSEDSEFDDSNGLDQLVAMYVFGTLFSKSRDPSSSLTVGMSLPLSPETYASLDWHQAGFSTDAADSFARDMNRPGCGLLGALLVLYLCAEHPSIARTLVDIIGNRHFKPSSMFGLFAVNAAKWTRDSTISRPGFYDSIGASGEGMKGVNSLGTGSKVPTNRFSYLSGENASASINRPGYEGLNTTSVGGSASANASASGFGAFKHLCFFQVFDAWANGLDHNLSLLAQSRLAAPGKSSHSSVVSGSSTSSRESNGRARSASAVAGPENGTSSHLETVQALKGRLRNSIYSENLREPTSSQAEAAANERMLQESQSSHSLSGASGQSATSLKNSTARPTNSNHHLLSANRRRELGIEHRTADRESVISSEQNRPSDQSRLSDQGRLPEQNRGIEHGRLSESNRLSLAEQLTSSAVSADRIAPPSEFLTDLEESQISRLRPAYVEKHPWKHVVAACGEAYVFYLLEFALFWVDSGLNVCPLSVCKAKLTNSYIDSTFVRQVRLPPRSILGKVIGIKYDILCKKLANMRAVSQACGTSPSSMPVVPVSSLGDSDDSSAPEIALPHLAGT